MFCLLRQTLDVTLAYPKGKDAESEEAQEHANSSTWRCRHKEWAVAQEQEIYGPTGPALPFVSQSPLISRRRQLPDRFRSAGNPVFDTDKSVFKVLMNP